MKNINRSTEVTKKESRRVPPQSNPLDLILKTYNLTFANLTEALSEIRNGTFKFHFEYTGERLALEVDISREILAAIGILLLLFYRILHG